MTFTSAAVTFDEFDAPSPWDGVWVLAEDVHPHSRLSRKARSHSRQRRNRCALGTCRWEFRKRERSKYDDTDLLAVTYALPCQHWGGIFPDVATVKVGSELYLWDVEKFSLPFTFYRNYNSHIPVYHEWIVSLSARLALPDPELAYVGAAAPHVLIAQQIIKAIQSANLIAFGLRHPSRSWRWRSEQEFVQGKLQELEELGFPNAGPALYRFANEDRLNYRNISASLAEKWANSVAHKTSPSPAAPTPGRVELLGW